MLHSSSFLLSARRSPFSSDAGHTSSFLSMTALAMFACLVMPAQAQTTEALSAPAATAAAAVVPSLIRFSGTLTDGRGYPITTPMDATFSLYAQPTAGSETTSPLWQEKQHLSPNEKGAYTVYLGATTRGVPAAIFTSVTAQYLGVKLDGEPELARVQLVSVPYAIKAADAATLGGLPASAFALAGGPSTSLAQTSSTGAAATNAAPDGTSNVTTTGGTSNYIPKFTGTSTVANSEIYDTGTGVGIGKEPSANIKLDVDGAMIMRGNMQVTRTGNATSSKAYPSYGFQFYSNLYNSSSKASDNPYYQLQSEPTGNNTSSPSATFNLLFANNASAVAETGLYFNPNGTIHFAPGQTFPGAGDITGVTASSPLTGGGTSGNVTIGLSTSSLESSLNSFYARLASANNFTSSATFAGPITGNSGSTMYAIQGNTSSGYGVQGYATGTSGSGVNGYSTGNGGIGVYGNATGNANGSAYPIGVQGHVFSGTAIKGVLDEALEAQTAILGQENGQSAEYQSYQGGNVTAGVWGDGANSSGLVPSGIIGTADNGYGGIFQNNSDIWPTLFIQNLGTAGTGESDVSAMLVGGKDGVCSIGSSGSLSCTGQMKSVVTTGPSQRKVETYAMQSPENWMEDFGTGELHGGSGRVTLEATFAQTVSESANYHVFLTPRGDSKGLYVTNLTSTSFEVHESGGGTASIGFDYRIVAKRRGLETQRLTDVTEKFQAQTKPGQPKPGQLKSSTLRNQAPLKQ